MKLACDQYYIDSERNPTGGIVGRTPNNERRYVNMAVTGIGHIRHIRIVMAIHKMLETKRAGHIRMLMNIRTI